MCIIIFLDPLLRGSKNTNCDAENLYTTNFENSTKWVCVELFEMGMYSLCKNLANNFNCGLSTNVIHIINTVYGEMDFRLQHHKTFCGNS